MKSIRFLFLVLASILSVSCEHEGLTPIETSDKIEIVASIGEAQTKVSQTADNRYVFNNGDDIHAIKASEIFGIPMSDVTPDIRRNAKAINFGIVYGISDYGLGQNIGISRAEANEYIKRYFIKYPKIEKYMQDNVDFCKANGFVKTYYGRVRFIPEITSSNYMQRMFGERAAMNMPLQGSASDIIKLAMIGVYNEINKRGLKSKLILQVHDELVIDAVKDEVEEVKQLLKDVMESVASLEVKLLASVNVGKNWLEAH